MQSNFSRIASVTLVSMLMAAAAHAGNSNGCQGNCPSDGGGTASSSANAGAIAAAGAVAVGVGLGGAGGAGGVGYGGQGGDAKAYGGAGGSVLGSGNSANQNTNLQGQQQGQGQQQSARSDQSQSSSNSVTGYGGNATGNGQGNTTSIDIAAPVIPKPAANSAYVGDLPQLPQGSCRLFIGGGGTTRDGSATGMFPIGNDGTCIATRSLEVMKQINATVGQTVFGKADMLDVACKIEGMDKLKACAK